MTISRNRLAFVFSALSFTIVMNVWPELFLWSKVVHLPSWTEALPMPTSAGAYVSLLCLLPAAFLTESFSNAKRALHIIVVIAPTVAVANYAFNPLHHDRYLLFNAVFHYFWIILFSLLLPAIVLGLIRKLANIWRHHGEH